jgi:hypothetical protein
MEGYDMMSESTFGSNGDSTIRPENLCSSTIEFEQVGKCTIDNTEFQNEAYCIELLHLATLQGDQDAWKKVQELLNRTVRGWVVQHPRRAEACRLDSEEYYANQAFATFYLLAIRQQIDFSQFSTALHHLKACLNSAILNKLRALSQPQTSTMHASGDSVKLARACSTDNVIIWKILQASFPSVSDQRLAFLLFHCGLSPKKIVKTYPQEFNDVCEISRLRHSMFELLSNYCDHSDEH